MSEDIVIKTPFGEVLGTRTDGVSCFRRLPYSEPCTGENRFAKPSKPPCWDECFDARAAGPVAPQLPSRLDAVMGAYDVPQDENCLHVDIWTPHSPDAHAPVLVFIHGGAFMTGGGSLPCYDGHALAKQTGLVVVTVTYRLGALGFMPMPEFNAINLGLHDQIAALRWINQAIQAFGGDPEHVTIAGQSAGAYSIAAMLGTDISRGLFNQAILMSAPLGLTLKTADDSTVRTALLHELGYNASQLDKLREIPVETMLKALARMQKTPSAYLGDVTPPFMPVIDGDLIPRNPLQALLEGRAVWCKTIVGITRDEHASFSIGGSALDDLSEEDLLAIFERQFGKDGKRMLEETRAKRVPTTSRMIVCDMRSDVDFIAPSYAFAHEQWKHGQMSTYAYQFDWQSPLPGLGAGHCLDLPFLFNNPPVWNRTPMLDGADPTEVQDLTWRFQGALAAFAKTGNPNGQGLPYWPEYAESKAVLHFANEVNLTVSKM
ncbi:MAG: pnbA 1 [Proteobacteria bacterium]|nr:pnbA 1 [Pseudomonadota bacterium]